MSKDQRKRLQRARNLIVNTRSDASIWAECERLWAMPSRIESMRLPVRPS